MKWVEDRLEHLAASGSGPHRKTRIEAAVTREGQVLALSCDHLEEYGACLRAPMPGPLYRMHGVTTGAYGIRNLAIRNRIVLTNKVPVSLVRGFGGPQIYLALERLMQRIAIELELDPLAVIRRNLVPANAFPYRTAAGALLDSGDYAAAIDKAATDGDLAALLKRRDEARAQGPALRHRLRVRGRAGRVEHGLSLHAPAARGAPQGRAEGRRDRHRHRRGRRQRHGHGGRRTRRRRARAIAPCWRRSSPTNWV